MKIIISLLLVFFMQMAGWQTECLGSSKTVGVYSDEDVAVEVTTTFKPVTLNPAGYKAAAPDFDRRNLKPLALTRIDFYEHIHDQAEAQGVDLKGWKEQVTFPNAIELETRDGKYVRVQPSRRVFARLEGNLALALKIVALPSWAHWTEDGHIVGPRSTRFENVADLLTSWPVPSLEGARWTEWGSLVTGSALPSGFFWSYRYLKVAGPDGRLYDTAEQLEAAREAQAAAAAPPPPDPYVELAKRLGVTVEIAKQYERAAESFGYKGEQGIQQAIAEGLIG
jgi:hypothetical protein